MAVSNAITSLEQPSKNFKEVAVTAVTFAAMFVNPLKGSTLTQQRKGIVLNICSIFSMVVHKASISSM